MFQLSLVSLLVVLLVGVWSSPVDRLTRRAAVVDLELQKEALNYMLMIHSDASCSVPQPRVIPIQQLHPNPSVVYATNCVVLHQCAADSGCCSASESCSPNETKEVTIPVMFQKPVPGEVQMLTFTNHTSCHCVSKKELAARA